MVGVKLAEEITLAMVTTKPDHQGEREISCNTIACGNAGCPGATVVTNACAFYLRARGYGCNGHPAFPAPFDFWAKNLDNNSGIFVPRECGGVCD